MAARSTRIVIKNRSDMQFVVSGVGTALPGGVWSDGGRPEPGTLLLEMMDLTIQSESSGLAPGTGGSSAWSRRTPGPRPRRIDRHDDDDPRARGFRVRVGQPLRELERVRDPPGARRSRPVL